MAEERTMTATFEPTLDVYKLLEGKPTEYIVVNPVAIEAKFDDGRVVRYPQEIRERIVRCRDCRYSFIGSLSGVTRCMRAFDRYTYGAACAQVAPDGFCAWGEERED